MVGVASSNLVSRSIFIILLLLLFTPLVKSKNLVTIKPIYCINNDVITLSTFGFDGEDNEILNLNGKKAAKISTKKLNEILKANFKEYKNTSFNSVAFIKNCTVLDEIQADFLYQLQTNYYGIEIENISIVPTKKIDINLNELRLKRIYFNVNKSNGSFRANLDNMGNEVLLSFNYSFKAKIPVFITNRAIGQKQILSPLDYSKIKIDFDKFNKNMLTIIPQEKLILTANIKANEIISKNKVKIDTLIKQGDSLNGFLNDSGIQLTILVTALNGGNIGNIIKVRTKEGKIFNAKIISAKQVMLK